MSAIRIQYEHRDLPTLEDTKDSLQEPLLDFDTLQAPPPASQPPLWKRWGGAIASAAGGITSLVTRVTVTSSHILNGITSMTTGLFTSSTISSLASRDTLDRIWQLSSPLVGPIGFFFITQAISNLDPKDDEQAKERLALEQTLLATVGFNLEILARRLYEERAIRIESQPLPSQKGETFREIGCLSKILSSCLPKYRIPSPYYANQYATLTTRVLKIGVGATTLLSNYAFPISTDPTYKGVSSFFATLYLSQAAGEITIDFLDYKIAQKEAAHPERGTNYRIAKTVLTTISYLGVPISAIPYNKPDTATRIAHLVYFGIGLGYCDGIGERSQIKRFERIPIEDLSELKKLPDPDPLQKVRYYAYRTSLYAVPILSCLGLIGFTVWQEDYVLTDARQKVALGGLLAGFLPTYAAAHAIDFFWDPKKRHFLKDNLMISLWASPRLLGVRPYMIYFVGTNALQIGGNQIGAGTTSAEFAGIFLSWFAGYGPEMALQAFKLFSPRIGNALLKRSDMVLFSGAQAADAYMRGHMENMP